ncbi:MAG: sugar phosphate nucleotidyltransferase [Candidatus Micrarchaeaceae archaeon]
MGKIEKAVITVAGKGLRMKPITSILPKCMLPIFSFNEKNEIVVEPLINTMLEKLREVKINKFCFVVGRHGAVLMNYLFGSEASFVFQNEPIGFGDAVRRAKWFAGDDPILVHADDGVLTGGYDVAMDLFAKESPDAVLLLRKTDNPKRYGIAEVGKEKEFEGHLAYDVLGVEEKPSFPKSNLMLSAVYLFSNKIFEELRSLKKNERTGEVELTDAIKSMSAKGLKIKGLLLEKEKWLNVGDAVSYFSTLSFTYSEARKRAAKLNRFNPASGKANEKKKV